MKTTKLLIIIVLFFMSQSCKKDVINNTTIKEEYNPAKVKIYGKWKIINTDSNDKREEYLIFDSSSPYAFQLDRDQYGFKSIQSSAYSATDKTLIYDGVYAYEVSNDSLFLKIKPDEVYIKLVKTNSSQVDVSNWVSKISTTRITSTLPGMSSLNYSSFSIDGDKLFYVADFTGTRRFYKYNTTNNSVIDSFSISGHVSSFYKKSTNQIYIASNSFTSFMPYKIADFTNSSTTAFSTTLLNNTSSLSFNPNSGVIYAFKNNRELLSGTEGGSLSLLFDASTFDLSFDQMTYFTNDEFLVLYNRKIHKVKISPTLTIIKSYDEISNFRIYSVSTNGSDIWVFGRNDINDKTEFRKINL